MKLHEIVDSLIELSTHEMPEEARKSLDDAIDHIVSNMTEQELQGVLHSSMKETIDEQEVLALKSLMEGNIAVA
tara:strand:+ start:753 stop:974 length:222 start_codon:yes stop_codon:yes gene_type:complete